jgi:hypothetical protein
MGAGWAGFSITSTLFWSVMIAGQLNYLTQTYLRQVYLVSQIDLLKNCEEIRIRTVLNNRSVFNLFGKKNDDSTGDVIVKIADVRFSEKDKPNSPIMRILAGDKRYYIHKNMSTVQDFELLKAVMSENIRKIECFK